MSDDKVRRRKPLDGVRVRRWTKDDLPALVDLHAAAYAEDYEANTHFEQRIFELQLAAFPEGQAVAEYEGRVIGYASSLIVQLDDDNGYTYDELTGGGTFSSHDPSTTAT